MNLNIGDKVRCIKTVKDGSKNFFTKGKIYECIENEYADEQGTCLKDNFELDRWPHHVDDDNGQLGDWFYKHFEIIKNEQA